jgi:RNA polymerase sigma factor (sigma-70 family)
MPAVLNALFETHRRSLLWSVMRIVRDPQTAEDVAQETYIRVRKAVENGQIDHLEAYLHRTAKNLALDHIRRRKVRKAVEAEGLDEGAINDIPHNVPSIEQVIMDRQKLCWFKDALSGLSMRAQAVMVLSRIEEWPNNRIAEHLGVSERTVFNDLKMAMAHCREALARHDRI